MTYGYYYISEPGSDAAEEEQHLDGETDVCENDDALLDKQHTVVNDKEARGMTH